MLDIKERDKSVDFAKGIAIIAVSFGHVMPVLYGNEDVVSKLCYSFELAVFFIVSGYLQFGKTGRGLLNYIKHSASSLLYPYVMFTAVIFVSDSMLNLLSQGFDQYIQSFPTRICSIVTWGAGACWFFPTFFISEMIAYFCRRDSRIQNIIKMFVLIIAGSVMCVIAEKYGYLKDVTKESIITGSFWLWHLFSLVSRSIVGASLILMGCGIKQFASEKNKKLNVGGYSRYVMPAVLIMIGLIAGYMNYDFIDLHFAFIRNPILFYVSAVSTTGALLLIGKMFHPACILWCGRESLLLILAQTGMNWVCVFIKKFVHTMELPYEANLAISLVVLITSLAISYFVIKLIRSSFLKILIIPPKRRKD